MRDINSLHIKRLAIRNLQLAILRKGMKMNFWNPERVQKISEREKVDAFIATTPHNVTYASGLWTPGGDLGFEPNFAIMPVDKPEIRGVVCFMAAFDQVVDLNLTMDNLEINPYGKFFYDRELDAILDPGDQMIYERTAISERLTEGINQFVALSQLITKYGLENRTIAIEEKGITCDQLNYLKGVFPNVKWLAADKLFREIRMVKSPEEVDRIRAVTQITEKAVYAAFKEAKDGVKEIELARVLGTYMVNNDAVPVLVSIGFGTRGCHPNALPTQRSLKNGDIIRFDVGACRLHYYSDLARIAVLGEPTDKTIKYYEALLNGQKAAFNLVKAGAKVRDIFNACMDAVHDSGMPHYKRHGVGHGIGAEFYDEPLITGTSDTVLEEGMVINIETPYYETGFGGLQTEDAVLVKEDGFEFLTSGKRPLYKV